MRDLNGIMLNEAHMIEKWNFSSSNLITCASMAYFRLPKNANIREGSDNTQTATVITKENAAING